MSWSQEQISWLIDLYKEHQGLYVVKHRDYHNKYLRNLALQDILKKLKCVRPTATEVEILKKFQGLRTTYNTERRKLVSSTRSGMGEEELYKPGLWYFEKMNFLDDHLSIRPSKSNFIVDEGSDMQLTDEHKNLDEIIEDGKYEVGDNGVLIPNSPASESRATSPVRSCSTTSITPTTVTSNKRKRKHTGSNEIEILQNVSTSLDNAVGALRPVASSTKTMEDTFGEFVASQLKMIANTSRKQKIQFEIHKLLYEAL